MMDKVAEQKLPVSRSGETHKDDSDLPVDDTWIPGGAHPADLDLLERLRALVLHI